MTEDPLPHLFFFCVCVCVILVPREETSFAARLLLASTPSNDVYELKKVRYHLPEQYYLTFLMHAPEWFQRPMHR